MTKKVGRIDSVSDSMIEQANLSHFICVSID